LSLEYMFFSLFFHVRVSSPVPPCMCSSPKWFFPPTTRWFEAVCCARCLSWYVLRRTYRYLTQSNILLSLGVAPFSNGLTGGRRDVCVVHFYFGSCILAHHARLVRHCRQVIRLKGVLDTV
jgi:hypothetical protein